MFNFFVFFYLFMLFYVLNVWIYVEFVVFSWYYQYFYELQDLYFWEINVKEFVILSYIEGVGRKNFEVCILDFDVLIDRGCDGYI